MSKVSLSNPPLNDLSCPPRVDVERHALHWAGKEWVIRHSLGGLFLQELWLAQLRNQDLTLANFHAACQLHGVRCLPNRKGIQRLLDALQMFFELLPVEHRPQLRTRPRGRTVGPWRWNVPSNSCWLVMPAVLDVSPRELATPNWGACHLEMSDVANVLLLADKDIDKVGNYANAAKRLQGLLELPHPPDVEALIVLRWLRAMRRKGCLADPQVAVRMAQLTSILRDLSPLWAQLVQAQIALLEARKWQEDQPHKALQTVAFDVVRQRVSSTMSETALMECCNLRALALRRLWQQELNISKQEAIADEALRQAQGAYFWACVSQDAYWQQATAINYAYLLQCLWEQELQAGSTVGSEALLQSALRWYSVADDWARYFDLPQDSAWDFLMFGRLYQLVCSRCHEVLDLNSASWPAEMNPRGWKFYSRAHELAERFGTPRQKIEACKLALWYLQHHAQADLPEPSSRLQVSLHKQLNSLKSMYPDVVADMATLETSFASVY